MTTLEAEVAVLKTIQKQHSEALRALPKIEIALAKVVATSKSNRWWMATLLGVAELIHLVIPMVHK